MRPLTTISIQLSSLQAIEAVLKNRLPGVDAFEIWLDHLAQKFQTPEQVRELCDGWKKLIKAKKLVVVCKDKQEQGKFTGYTRHTVDLLIAASQGGADFVDISLFAGKRQIDRLKQMKKGRTKLIISWHNFAETPGWKRLQRIQQRISNLSPDVIKIASHVENVQDNENLMNLALEMKKTRQKHIVLGMGTLGMVTRVFATQLGNELNFVSLDKLTAPGQLTLNEILGFNKVLNPRQ